MPSVSRLRLTHIDLGRWRNFVDASVDLAPRAFLVGPNASGKSNFLDVVRFLHDLVDEGGGLRSAVRRRDGISRIRSLAARRDPSIRVHVCVGTDDEPRLWDYELVIAQGHRTQPEIRKERVAHATHGTVFDRPDREDRSDPDRLSQTFLEQVNMNRGVRELVSFLAAVRYMHIVPQLVREPERSTGIQGDPFGGDFVQQIASVPRRTRDARLRRILKALQVAVPQLTELTLDDSGARPHLQGRYVHWRAKGAWQSEDEFSDGTLRLLGLLWAVLDGDGPLLLEEPELSLHPGIVRHIPQMLARSQRTTGRQVIISTSSSDLLRDPGIGLDEVLLLIPDSEGTHIEPAARFEAIRALLETGVELPEAIIPRTSPNDAGQLALFGA